jgi:hypothetical protein
MSTDYYPKQPIPIDTFVKLAIVNGVNINYCLEYQKDEITYFHAIKTVNNNPGLIVVEIDHKAGVIEGFGRYGCNHTDWLEKFL